MRTYGWSFSQQGAWLLLLLLIFLVPACATTRDPTEMSEVRWELERLAEDRFLADGELGARSCVLDAMGERCREWRQFRADLLRLAADAPQDRYVVGQVVYSLVRSGAHDEALAILRTCGTVPWWCQALGGFALAESGRVVEAEAAFDEALRSMPRDERCEWTDLSALVSGDVESAHEEASCPADLDRFWWLVDAAWLIPGNEGRLPAGRSPLQPGGAVRAHG